MSFEQSDKPEIDVFTDLEPDDVLALMLLARFFRFRAIFVVCSENPWWPRLPLLERLLESLGTRADLVLPIGDDGQPVAASLRSLEAHFSHQPRRPLVQLASFEPLVEIYRSAPQILSSLDVVAYGSVNIRWALRRSPEQKELLLGMVHGGFNSISVFETYFAYGESGNTFNPIDTPRVCSFLSASTHPACVCLTTCIREWNESLLSSQANALIKHDPETFGCLKHEETGELVFTGEAMAALRAASADRSFEGFTKARVVLDILRSRESQMVAADPGAAILAIALFGPQAAWTDDLGAMMLSTKAHLRPVRITIPDAFVVLHEEKGSKVRYFKPDAPGPTFLTMLEDQILSILHLALQATVLPV